MLALMDLQTGEDVETYGHRDVLVPGRVKLKHAYIKEMIYLVESCLVGNPNDRIDAEELLGDISKEIMKKPNGFVSTPLKYQSWNEK